DARGPQGGPQRFDAPDRQAGQQHGFGDSPAIGAAGAPAPPAFPPGVPSFVDPPASNRPVNGVRPHEGDRPGDQFGGPMGGATAVQGAVPGHPPAPYGEPTQVGFPPQGPQSGPAWGAEPEEQGRFDAFKPEADAQKAEAPPPKVRNGRVLAAVLVAAVLILAVPLGLLMLLGKVGGDNAKPFDPAVGSCVKQSGESATSATCGEAGSFTIVSKVETKEKCADPGQPHVVLRGDVPKKVLCLKSATK
ncbi:hypothetical protein QLR68_27480, partial [Micromonospora sp. DH15]|nr:hypothetical protein [Micromonospora sp. DH15]